MSIKIIESNRNTKLVAIRRGIEESLRYFEENREEVFTGVKTTWKDDRTLEEQGENVVLRREIISQYLGVECLSYWEAKNGTLGLHRDEYLELWELLKENQKEVIKKLFPESKIFK